MLREHGDKPIEKSGQRNRKAEQQGGKKPRNRKSGQQASPSPVQDVEEQVSAPAPPAETASADTAGAENSTAAASPAHEAVAAPEADPVSLQSIANAYGDYTRKSLEQTKFFFERLAAVRSLDKAFELQADFGKQAYETFIVDSQKIRELHRDLAKQNLERLEGFMTRMTDTR